MVFRKGSPHTHSPWMLVLTLINKLILLFPNGRLSRMGKTQEMPSAKVGNILILTFKIKKKKKNDTDLKEPAAHVFKYS